MSSSGQTVPPMSEIGERAPIGIIGGSGLDTLPDLKEIGRERPQTPYGKPSSDLILGELGGHRVVFIPRHGVDHRYPPHLVPYKANLAALKSLGVKTVVATCIAGSLKELIEPGHFVVPDQFVNLTWGRDASGEVGRFVHLPMAEPYCGKLRGAVIAELEAMSTTVHDGGTIAVIQGPRFSTKAESRMLISNGWDVVNMTQYPEGYFARELGLCYAVAVSVTDWDVGIPSALSMHPESMERVLQIFRTNVQLTRNLLERVLQRLQGFQCDCAHLDVTRYDQRA